MRANVIPIARPATRPLPAASLDASQIKAIDALIDHIERHDGPVVLTWKQVDFALALFDLDGQPRGGLHGRVEGDLRLVHETADGLTLTAVEADALHGMLLGEV